jgi:hypothetical protein
MTSPLDNLKAFILERMRMSHIYQPVMLGVMLGVLLERGGRASISRTIKA